jgi:hypothetical protein
LTWTRLLSFFAGPGPAMFPAIVGLLNDDQLGATRDWVRTAEDSHSDVLSAGW